MAIYVVLKRGFFFPMVSSVIAGKVELHPGLRFHHFGQDLGGVGTLEKEERLESHKEKGGGWKMENFPEFSWG